MRDQMYWAKQPETPQKARRRRRLKIVFEGRCSQLEDAKRVGLDGHPNQQRYGSAVHKYARARTAWRAFRGWR